MGCNAWNHTADCPCDFRGGHGGGGYGGGDRSGFVAVAVERGPAGWSCGSTGTVTSYVNPNARCPVCGASVFFYRSPYDGRVFFDELGPPWPKHWCTDNSRDPHRAPQSSVSPPRLHRAVPSWRELGWGPLVSIKSYISDNFVVLTGDVRNKFLELSLLDAGTFDRDGPVLARARTRQVSSRLPFFDRATSTHNRRHASPSS